jgi:hypothetical protein
VPPPFKIDGFQNNLEHRMTGSKKAYATHNMQHVMCHNTSMNCRHGEWAKIIISTDKIRKTHK